MTFFLWISLCAVPSSGCWDSNLQPFLYLYSSCLLHISFWTAVFLHFIFESYCLSSKAPQNSFLPSISALCDSCSPLIRLQNLNFIFHSSVVTSLTAIWHECRALPCLFLCVKYHFQLIQVFPQSFPYPLFPWVSHCKKENHCNTSEKGSFWTKSSLRDHFSFITPWEFISSSCAIAHIANEKEFLLERAQRCHLCTGVFLAHVS